MPKFRSVCLFVHLWERNTHTWGVKTLFVSILDEFLYWHLMSGKFSWNIEIYKYRPFLCLLVMEQSPKCGQITSFYCSCSSNCRVSHAYKVPLYTYSGQTIMYSWSTPLGRQWNTLEKITLLFLYYTHFTHNSVWKQAIHHFLLEGCCLSRVCDFSSELARTCKGKNHCCCTGASIKKS